MAVYEYEEMIPTPVTDAEVLKVYREGVHRHYWITPLSGYVLHDKNNDWMHTNPDTLEETYTLGYARGTCTCHANYDFEENPREFYTVPEDSVPSDQIFGVYDPEHEIM